MNYCNCPNCQTVNCPAALDEAESGASVRSSELVGLARALDALNLEDDKVNKARGLCNTSARLEAMGAVLQAWACVRHRVQPNESSSPTAADGNGGAERNDGKIQND